MSLLSSLASRLFPAYARQLHGFKVLSCDLGQLRSIKTGQAVDGSGRPIPWYTYPAIEYLLQFDFSGCAVFEYGSGNSSRFWAQRARRVVSVEHDSQWYRTVTAEKAANQSVLLRTEKAAFVDALTETGQLFDVIVIDARWRLSCARVAATALAAGGMIVLDNSDWFPACATLLRDAGRVQVDFSGFGPVNGYPWTTSLFFDGTSRLQAGLRAPCPIGGVRQRADEDD